jgi:hypothetical protein
VPSIQLSVLHSLAEFYEVLPLLHLLLFIELDLQLNPSLVVTSELRVK